MNNEKNHTGETLRNLLDKAAEISLDGYDIVIWGAGNTIELNKETIIEEKLLPCFFADGNRGKWGGRKWDIEIISPDEIRTRCANPLILLSSANAKTCREIITTLKGMQFSEYHLIDEVVWGRHREELMSVYNMLECEKSKELFAQIIISRMTGEDIPEQYVTDNQYFSIKEFKLRNEKEVFVDCGAYVGDTIEQYLNIKEAVFSEIYAFEPDPGNITALSKRMERLRNEWNIAENRIHIIEGAVGKEDSSCFINNDFGGFGAKITDANTGNKTKIYGLDGFLKDVPVGFLKADIESYELDMLLGAAEIIRKHKPLLAICVYHQSADLYKIPLLLKKLNIDYRLDIAQHYYNYTETILYAY